MSMYLGAAERLRAAVDARGPHDETRIREELAWFTARPERAEAILALTVIARRMRQRGFLPAPALERPGGSLVAYALGLSAFDPMAWDLPFDPPNGLLGDVLLASASARAITALELPLFLTPGAAHYRFVEDAELARVEEQFPSIDWRVDAALERLAMTVRGEPVAWTNDADVLPKSACFTRPTGGRIVYPDQLAATIAATLNIPIARASSLGHGLLKHDGAEALGALDEAARAARLRHDDWTIMRARIVERASSRPRRSAALAAALCRLETTRRAELRK